MNNRNFPTIRPATASLHTLLALGLTATLCLPHLAAAAGLAEVSVVDMDGKGAEAGGDSASFLITRVRASIEKPLAVSFTLSGSASRGADYADPGITVTLPAQTPAVLLTIAPKPDTLCEGTETVVLSLVEKPGAYALADEKVAQATITDAPSGACGTPTQAGNGASLPLPPSPLPPPIRIGSQTRQPKEPTGTLFVSVAFDGTGAWRNPGNNGEYRNTKYHRLISYTVPLKGYYGIDSGFSNINRRDQSGGSAMPNFKRYLALKPKNLMSPAGGACGQGKTEFMDESHGMQVGDPGMPPLVPFTETLKGGGKYPSGDPGVPERDLCEAAVTLDTDKHVYHLRIDGSDAHVKVLDTYNNDRSRSFNMKLQGDNGDGNAKAKLTFFDLPIKGTGDTLEGSRVINNFNTVDGPEHTSFPLHATVKWHIKLDK